MPEITLKISEKTWDDLLRLAQNNNTAPHELLTLWIAQRVKSEVTNQLLSLEAETHQNVQSLVWRAIRVLRDNRNTPTAPLALEHARQLERIAVSHPIPELRAALPLLRADWFLLIPPPEYTAALRAIRKATASWSDLPLPSEVPDTPSEDLPRPAR